MLVDALGDVQIRFTIGGGRQHGHTADDTLHGVRWRVILRRGRRGETASVHPDGYAKKLPAGSRLVFQMHYTPNGKQGFDHNQLGMIFAKEPPIFEVKTAAIINSTFEIRPGAASHEVRAGVKLEEDLGLMALSTHMHKRGKDFQFSAHYPDGSEEELLFVDYDFNWQESYLYPDPKLLPSGTRLDVIGHFDNTA